MRKPTYKRIPLYIVSSAPFIALTTLLTFFALIGDDMRLLCTDKPADAVFNSLILVTLAVFTAEVVLSTLGQDDYFLSLFFFLDIFATATLVLDITWVLESIQDDGEDEVTVLDAQAARMGGRLGRIVRIIRLVRIMKLYKSAFEWMRLKTRRKEDAELDLDALGDMPADSPVLTNSGESMVGKKLSALTLRRLLCVVLLMLLVVPMFPVDLSERCPTSAAFGADLVHGAFTQMQSSLSDADLRLRYENSLLTYLYYHNWYMGQADECPYESHNRYCAREYTSHVFWVGIVGSDGDVIAEKAAAAEVRPSTVASWEQSISQRLASLSAAFLYNFGHMPQKVQSVLGRQWDFSCNSGRYRRLGVSLISEVIPDKVDRGLRCPEDLRTVERKKYTALLKNNRNTFQEWHFAFYFDIRSFVKIDAVFSIATTLLVCVLLCVASIMFINDARVLVLRPLENMLAKVEVIKNDPSMATKLAGHNFNIQAMQQEKAIRHSGYTKVLCDKFMCVDRTAKAEVMETVVLENTLIKLGSLLVLGFGQAGARIIGHNMSGAGTAQMDIAVEGTRVDCVIGVTRIRNFVIATEVLKAKVMTFVNHIAEIVHGIVDECHGAANKNSGDTFLVIWRLSDLLEDQVKRLADLSMLAFTRILGAVHKSQAIAAYYSHPGLQQKMRQGCGVNLSSSLHYGWAIEGTIGSEFKIDAAYLSPNVSTAESVERATQIYGVNMLVTESMISVSTPAMAAKCRLVDHVNISGFVHPIELYVVDLDYMSLKLEAPAQDSRSFGLKTRLTAQQLLQTSKNRLFDSKNSIVDFFNQDADISTMRARYTLGFIHVFNMGYQNYAQGEWQVARAMLKRSQSMLGVEDGPSSALLCFMESYKFSAPEHWQGIRSLNVPCVD